MGGFGGNGCMHMMSLSTFQRQATAIFVFTCLVRTVACFGKKCGNCYVQSLQL